LRCEEVFVLNFVVNILGYVNFWLCQNREHVLDYTGFNFKIMGLQV